MTKFWMACLAASALAAPALAEDVTGDAANGEKLFRQCQSCHVVQDEDGNTIAGRNGRTGPNLYGLPGRQAGSVEDFRYSKSLEEAGKKGLHWDQEHFVAFVQDTSGFLKEYLDDSGARSKMSFRVRSEEDAADLYAFLASVSPEPEMDEGESDAGETEDGDS